MQRKALFRKRSSNPRKRGLFDVESNDSFERGLTLKLADHLVVVMLFRALKQ